MKNIFDRKWMEDTPGVFYIHFLSYIFFDKMYLRLFYFHVTIYSASSTWRAALLFKM